MNIKYIVNVRIPTPRAQGYAIMKMCEEFARSGAKLDLIIPKRGNSNDKEDPFAYYDIKPIFNIIRVKSFDFLGKTFKLGRLFYWVDLISFFVSLRRHGLVKENDVIYTRDFTIPVLFSKKRFICLELHEIPRFKFLFRLAIKKPKLFFVLNENIKKVLVEMGVTPSIVYISPSGVDLNEFDIDISKKDAREKINLITDKKIVMYTGHLYGWKGADTLANVAEFLPELMFVFVGGIDSELERFTKKYTAKNITLLPFKARNMIPFYLKAADLLVIPNSSSIKISSEYTSPLKLFEYMASKRPIISSDLPSLRAVLNETNCVFAKADNIQSFKEAISKILNDEKLASDISVQAFEDVQKYTWQKRVEDIMKVIENNL
jgi:glycosyltransferase involved in cell wall biosynthesis